MKPIIVSAIDASPSVVVLRDAGAMCIRLTTAVDFIVAELDETGRLALAGWLLRPPEESEILNRCPNLGPKLSAAMSERR